MAEDADPESQWSVYTGLKRGQLVLLEWWKTLGAVQVPAVTEAASWFLGV